jgi:hypothetical protein
LLLLVAILYFSNNTHKYSILSFWKLLEYSEFFYRTKYKSSWIDCLWAQSDFIRLFYSIIYFLLALKRSSGLALSFYNTVICSIVEDILHKRKK